MPEHAERVQKIKHAIEEADIVYVSDDELTSFMKKYACCVYWRGVQCHLYRIRNFYGDEISIEDARRAMRDTALLLKLVGEKCFLYGPDCYEKSKKRDTTASGKAEMEYYMAKYKLFD